MARVLLVGCGCRGREVGRLLLESGWAVRGTSRRTEGRAAIEAAGIEAAEADPDQLGGVVELLADVSVLVWALGSATGAGEEIAALHGPRLESLLAKLVDTPVRGFIYEATGGVDDETLAVGRLLVADAAARWRIPVVIVEEDPADWQASSAAIAEAVRAVVVRR